MVDLKINFLPLEKVDPHIDYAITVNLPMKNLLEPVTKLYNRYKYFISRRLKPFIEHAFVCYELSNHGKLHFHGTIRFRSFSYIILFYRQDFNCAIKLDTLSHPDIWKTYCLKQSKYHDTLLELYNIKALKTIN